MPDQGLALFADSLLEELAARFPMGYTPNLVWKNLRVTAGVAHFKSRAITLSSVLMTDEDRVSITLRHEYAHLLAYSRHGRQGIGHGKPWRQAMVELGLVPEVRHTYEVQRNEKRQQVVYQCSRCGFELVKARRFQKRVRYLHRDCGGVFKFNGQRTLDLS